MNSTLNCNVLVIGSGPGGSVTALNLVEAGYDVIMVEEGPDASQADIRPYSSNEMDVCYRNGGLTPFLGSKNYTYVEASCLGGGSEVNSGFYHAPSEDLLTYWNATHNLDISVDSLAPHVKAVHKALNISLSPVGECTSSALLKRGADELGWKSAEIPRWISSDKDEAGNWQSTRSSMSKTYISNAISRGLRCITQFKVERLILQHDCAVSAIGCVRELNGSKRRVTITFEHVYVCCGAIQTPILLRRSGIKYKIGDSLTTHPMVRLVAKFDQSVHEAGVGVPFRQVTEFLPKYTFGCSHSGKAHVSLWLPPDLPNRDHLLENEADSLAVYYMLYSSDVKGKIRTIVGSDSALVYLRLTEKENKEITQGILMLAQLLFAAGCTALYSPALKRGVSLGSEKLKLEDIDLSSQYVQLSTIHLFGSCPMGVDGLRHPVDPYGKLYGFANVYLNDASILPTSTGVNPQGTLMAIATRNVLEFLNKRGQATLSSCG